MILLRLNSNLTPKCTPTLMMDRIIICPLPTITLNHRISPTSNLTMLSILLPPTMSLPPLLLQLLLPNTLYPTLLPLILHPTKTTPHLILHPISLILNNSITMTQPQISPIQEMSKLMNLYC